MSDFKKATGASIQEAFENFHKDNPIVFAKLTEQAKRAMTKKKKFSVKQIIGWIRWEFYMETKDTLFEKQGLAKFKINDAYTSRYARKLIELHPEMEQFVETRKLRS